MLSFSKPTFIDISKLKVIPEYEKLIFRMLKDDDEAFDKSVKENGILKPIEINDKNIVLDEKERYYKALKYKIKLVPHLVKHFDSKLEEEKYIYEVNLKQRHLLPIQKVMLAVPLLKIEQEFAKLRSKKNLKNSSIASPEAIEKKGKSAKKYPKKMIYLLLL